MVWSKLLFPVDITDANLSTTDITTNDVSTSKHGFTPKAVNLGKFLKDDATWAVRELSKGGTVLSPTGAINVICCTMIVACTVTAVKGYRVGGTGATINARKNDSLNHLASALSLTSADTWMDGGAVSNIAYAIGDKLEIMIVTIAGAPTQVAVQVNFTRP